MKQQDNNSLQIAIVLSQPQINQINDNFHQEITFGISPEMQDNKWLFLVLNYYNDVFSVNINGKE